MALRGDSQRYGLVARILHWLVAVLFVLLAAGGTLIVQLDYQDPLRLVAIKAHRTLGLTMLGLILLRLGWALVDIRPGPPAGIGRRDLILAKLAHRSFYGLLIVIPILGFLFSGAGGGKVQLAGFELDSVASFSRPVASWLITMHKWITIATVLVICAHVGGVIKHHRVDKVKILRRML